jgi:hypothetical protein
MAIQRYNSPRSYYFDPGSKGAQEPYISLNTDTGVAVASTSWSLNTYFRSGTVGATNPGYYHIIHPAAVTASVQAGLQWGNVFNSAQATTLSSYYTAPAGIPAMVKTGNNTLWTSFIWRAPSVGESTTAACDTIYLGLFRSTGGTQANSLLIISPSASHVVGGQGTGYLNMNVAAYSNATASPTNANLLLPADVETRFTMTIDTVGNFSWNCTTTAGVFLAGGSGTFANPRGNFGLNLSHSYASSVSNYTGIRDLRVVIS